jgi:DNA-binding CsgD family transcriptional regulator
VAVEPLPLEPVPEIVKTRRRRARTISVRRLSRAARARAVAAYPETARGAWPIVPRECPEPDADGVRRCAHVTCPSNRALEVTAHGSIKVYLPILRDEDGDGVETLDLSRETKSTCLEDWGESLTLEEVASAWNLSRERVRQLEGNALAKLRAALAREGLTLAQLCAAPPPETAQDRAERGAPGHGW